MNILEFKNLTKEYRQREAPEGKVVALQDATFSVGKSEFFGYLGPNGAGKTTTIRILCGLSKPSSGTIKVLDYDISDAKHTANVKKVIGFVPEYQNFDYNLTVKEQLVFHGRYYGMKRPEAEEKALELLKFFNLNEWGGAPIYALSHGMSQKLLIARALMHDPKILVLDEPTLGLDPSFRRVIWEYLRRLQKEKEITFFMSTHYMEEAEDLCNRIALLNKGKIAVIGTFDYIKEKMRMYSTIEIKASPTSKEIQSRLQELPFVKGLEIISDVIKIQLDSLEENVSEVIALLERSKIKIHSVKIFKTTLEDVFIELVK